MLLNRISFRAWAAIGAAAFVSTGAVAVQAIADEPSAAEQAVAAGGFANVANTESTGTTVPTDLAAQRAAISERAHDTQVQRVRDQIAEELRKKAEAKRKAALERKREAEERAARERAASGADVSPGSARDIARGMLSDYGWSSSQFGCLDSLWEKESNWNHTASNPSSGAYGIPQALPGSKMATAGDDWETNPATQIEWGLGYIEDRYGSPCEAWSHSQANGWY